MHRYQGPGRSVAYSTKGMCCTSHPLAALTALDIMRQGGNAIDAAVAGAVVLGFCEPMMCGLGGDVFAMISTPDRENIVGLNSSGRSPGMLDAALLRDQAHTFVPLESVHSITLPGAVEGFDRLVRDWGKLDLAEVLQPAIRYAEEGVPVCHRSALDWASFGGRLWGSGVQHYLDHGRAYTAGQRFTSPAQAEALRLIAQDGKDAFYRGAIMEDMLSTLNAAGGVHSPEDFASVKSEYVEPISIDYRGFTLTELPPNGQGVTALLLAKILERFDIGKMDPNGARRVHLEAEATRLAYDARDRFVGDPAKTRLRLDHMLSDRTADSLAALIDPDRAQPHIRQQAEAVHRDTVYICAVDANRCAISLIYSTFWPFGSGLASERFGISFQNRGAGFNLIEGHVNELQGGKRPLHTLIPGFVQRSGDFLMPFGVMGGAYQATGHAHVLSNIVDFSMDIQAAIDAPRSFADPSTGKLTLERGFSDDVVATLADMGHEIERVEVGMGGAQAIQIDSKKGLLVGGTDPRKDGVALGY